MLRKYGIAKTASNITFPCDCFPVLFYNEWGEWSKCDCSRGTGTGRRQRERSCKDLDGCTPKKRVSLGCTCK